MDRVARINIARSPELIDSNIEVVYYYAVSLFSKNVLFLYHKSPAYVLFYFGFAFPFLRPEGDASTDNFRLSFEAAGR